MKEKYIKFSVFTILIIVLIGISSIFLPPVLNSQYSLPLNFGQNISKNPFCLPLPPYKKRYGDWNYTTYSVPRYKCLLQIAIKDKNPNICDDTGNLDCWKDYGKQTENPLECELLQEKSMARYECINGFFQKHSRQPWCDKLKLEGSDRIDLGCGN